MTHTEITTLLESILKQYCDYINFDYKAASKSYYINTDMKYNNITFYPDEAYFEYREQRVYLSDPELKNKLHYLLNSSTSRVNTMVGTL